MSGIIPAAKTSLTSTVNFPLQIVKANPCTLCSSRLLITIFSTITSVLPTKRICLPITCPGCAKCISKLAFQPKPTFKSMALEGHNEMKKTFVPNNCAGCEVCIPEPQTQPEPQPEPEPEEPQCPQLDCLQEVCLYGTKSTVLPNGCKGCDECLPKPPCKKLFCIKPKCPYGTVPTVLSSGCPGCDVCRKCDACPGESTPTILPDGSTGCPQCLPCP